MTQIAAYFSHLNEFCDCPDSSQHEDRLPQVLVEGAPRQHGHRLLDVQLKALIRPVQRHVRGVVCKVVARQGELKSSFLLLFDKSQINFITAS